MLGQVGVGSCQSAHVHTVVDGADSVCQLWQHQTVLVTAVHFFTRRNEAGSILGCTAPSSHFHSERVVLNAWRNMVHERSMRTLYVTLLGVDKEN